MLRVCEVLVLTLASLMGFLIVHTAAQAPALRVDPSMIEASISWVPELVNTLPLPALNHGQSSSKQVTSSATSTAVLPCASSFLPAWRIFLNSANLSLMVSVCLISPAPPWMAARRT